MKWAPYCAVILILALAGAGPFATAQTTQGNADLQTQLEERIGEGNGGTCIVAGVIDDTGAKVVSFGRLSRSSSRAADGDTIFEIGSATKAFTGLLLADMIEKGQVRLDDPVSKFLPRSVKVPARNGRQITLLDLATHTSGLPRLPDNLAPRDPGNPYADYTPQQMYTFLSGYILQRDIGTKYEYSNLGVGLLGHALTRSLGTDYESAIQQRICTPLGMKDTRIKLSQDMKSRLASGYDAGGQPVQNWDLATLAGAGAIRSSAKDLLKFVGANAGLSRSSLWPAIQLAQKPRHDAGSPNVDVGLCWHISKNHGHPLVWHNGQTAGYHSFIGFDPGKRRGVVVLINAGRSIDDLGFHLLDPGSPLSKPQVAKGDAIKLAPEILDRYVGRYELAPGVFFNLRREGDQLKAQITGQAYADIFPRTETEFFYKVVDAQLSFVKDEHGKVSGLVLHQNGADQSARRISDEPPAERQAIKLDPRLYDAYTGEYELAPGVVFTIRKEADRLLARVTGQEFFEIFPESKDKFFYKVVDAQITFLRDGQNHVTGLMLHQNGQDQRAKRTR